MSASVIQPISNPKSSDHIEITPDVCGGRPRISGHRITVQNIVLCHERGGMSPDEIVSRYPGIGLADVYAALAYYHDHQSEIRSQIAADENFANEERRNASSLVKQKLAQANA